MKSRITLWNNETTKATDFALEQAYGKKLEKVRPMLSEKIFEPNDVIGPQKMRRNLFTVSFCSGSGVHGYHYISQPLKILKIRAGRQSGLAV